MLLSKIENETLFFRTLLWFYHMLSLTTSFNYGINFKLADHFDETINESSFLFKLIKFNHLIPVLERQVV